MSDHQNSHSSEPDENVHSLPQPLVSVLDDYNYRNIILKNGVRSFLISSCGALNETSKFYQTTRVDSDPSRSCIKNTVETTSIFNRRGKRGLMNQHDKNIKSKFSRTLKIPYCAESSKSKPGLFSTLTYFLKSQVKSTFDYLDPQEDDPVGWGLPDLEEISEQIRSEQKFICQGVENVGAWVKFTLNIACGTINDPPEAPGLAHVTLKRITDWIHSDLNYQTEAVVHTENSTIDGYIYRRQGINLGVLLNEFLKSFETAYKEESNLVNILDRMDLIQENIQCQVGWEDPVRDQRRLKILFSLVKDGHPLGKIGKVDALKLYELLDSESGNSNGSKLSLYSSEFSKTHYLPSKMSFTIEAPETLDELENMVSKAFSIFPENINIQSVVGDEDPFETDDFTRFYTVKCNYSFGKSNNSPKNCDYIILAWGLPPKFWKAYEVKPLEYLAAVLSDERHGGLCHYLLSKNFAVSVRAGCSNDGEHRNQFLSLFEIVIQLRDEGLDHLDEVIEAIFSYLKFLKLNGPFKEFYQELRKLRLFDFIANTRGRRDETFGGHRSGYSQSSGFQGTPKFPCITHFDPENIMVGSKLFHHYDEDMIHSCTALLVPEKANYMLCIKENTMDGNDLMEPILKTKYSVKDVTEDQYNKWRNATPFSEFEIPKSNRFINSEFCRRFETNSKEITLYDPENLDIKSRIWYQHDLAPNNYCIYNIHFVSTEASSSAENAGMLTIWFKMLNEMMNPILHEMEAADIKTCMQLTQFGILLDIYSWNNSIVEALKVIVIEIVKFNNVAISQTFERIKKDSIRSLLDKLTDDMNYKYYARIISDDIYKCLTEVKYYTIPELISAMKSITFKELLNFAQEFKNNISVCGLIRGNIGEENAINLTTILEEYLKPKSLNTLKRIRMYQLPRGESIIQYKFKTTDLNRVINYYQIGQSDTKMRFIAEFAIACITTEQYKLEDLIYSGQHSNSPVSTKSRNIKNSLEEIKKIEWKDFQHKIIDNRGILTMIVENRPHNDDGIERHNSHEEMNTLIQNGLDRIYTDIFEKMSPRAFNKMKLKFKPEDDELPPFYYNEYQKIIDRSQLKESIQDLTFRFNKRTCRLTAWDELTLQDVQNFWKRYLSPSSSEFRKLSIQAISESPSYWRGGCCCCCCCGSYESKEKRRERRKTFRNCYRDRNNKFYDFMILNSPNLEEKIDYQFVSQFEQKHENDKCITIPQQYKEKLFKYPISVIGD